MLKTRGHRHQIVSFRSTAWGGLGWRHAPRGGRFSSFHEGKRGRIRSVGDDEILLRVSEAHTWDSTSTGVDEAEVTESQRASGIIGFCTILSKLTGLVREVLLTALFGIGPVMDAFTYAAVVPAYFQTVIGGLNGPFHTAVMVRSSGRNKLEMRKLVETLSSWMAIFAIALSGVLLLFPEAIVRTFAPGLHNAGAAGVLESQLASTQLQIMSPCVLTGTLCGIGFGALNAVRKYVPPSLSPAIANVAMITSLIIFQGAGSWQQIVGASQGVAETVGAVHIALAFTLGSICQLIFQAVFIQRNGLGRIFTIRLRWKDFLGVLDVFQVLVPATIASTMLQIASYTDFFFASSSPGAAATILCASMVVMAPVGLLSNVIIIPHVPRLAELAASRRWKDFSSAASYMLMSAINLGLPLSISIFAFAGDITKAVYERRAFTAAATSYMTPVVMANAVGVVFYLARDVLVRSMYALGKGTFPAFVSVGALFLNAALDACFCATVPHLAFGLVSATVIVSAVSTVLLFLSARAHLNKRGCTLLDPELVRFAPQSAAAAVAAGAYCVLCRRLLLPAVRAFLDGHVGSSWLSWGGNTLTTGIAVVSTWLVYFVVVRARVGSATGP